MVLKYMKEVDPNFDTDFLRGAMAGDIIIILAVIISISILLYKLI
jgi:hypothetical protein